MSKKVEVTKFWETKGQLLDALKTMSFLDGNAEKEAFLKGIKAHAFISDDNAMLAELIALSDSPDGAIAHVQNSVVSKLAANNQAELHQADCIFELLETSPEGINKAIEGIRGAVNGGAYVNTAGVCCSSDGTPEEDNLFQTLDGKAVTPWGAVKFYDPTTKMLSDTQSALPNSVPINVTFLEVAEDAPIEVNIFLNPRIFEAGIRRDIKQNPETVWRYMLTASNRQNGTHEIINGIIEAAKTVPCLELSGSNEMLIKMVKEGRIGCMQHMMLATLEILRTVDDHTLSEASDEAVRRYIGFVDIALQAKKQNNIITDDVLSSYKDGNGEPWKGIDNNGRNVAGSNNTAECKRNYLCELGKKVALKLHQVFVASNKTPHTFKKALVKLYYDANL